MTATQPFLQAFFALPAGTSTGRFKGNPYVLTRTELAGGKSQKLVAHQLGGPDYISLNLYLTKNSGALLRPCEMSVQKVTDFVFCFQPDY
ncbi:MULTISPECIES: hypothetical protein [unclassified Ruegeria]|uniref:hypothetical protein n=1 Tax=Ruegeria sp. HKCCA5491 TaxID=2682986 RepID=UPI00148A03F1|nr:MULTISPECIES: hypothetical protein [unclassified Ruegeria]